MAWRLARRAIRLWRCSRSCFCSNGARSPIRRRGGGARPAVVPPLLRPAAGRGDARPRLDPAVSPDDRQARSFGWAIDRGQLAARCARPDQHGSSTRPSSQARSGASTCAPASIRATPRLVSPASAIRPISATRRIWRWTRRAGWRPGRDDPGRCARFPSGRSADPG